MLKVVGKSRHIDLDLLTMKIILSFLLLINSMKRKKGFKWNNDLKSVHCVQKYHKSTFWTRSFMKKKKLGLWDPKGSLYQSVCCVTCTLYQDSLYFLVRSFAFTFRLFLVLIFLQSSNSVGCCTQIIMLTRKTWKGPFVWSLTVPLSTYSVKWPVTNLNLLRWQYQTSTLSC